ncbi:hypothetical protein N7495_005486 [Penicillium taxi]|uniref:uncharacterized protein n=1 Tax=Penicillium taxi TaxID=168475 RepID=UPI002544F958|nr:uncharacterized protein N7495_005486 [Penicillium taxi]KAJ5893795.1 hypothetical protein N7495_005486 [Penicillium taxi]
MSLLRSNGIPGSCEPCRKSKLRCDHSAPCGRCRRRNKIALCVYHPAPMTRGAIDRSLSSSDSLSRPAISERIGNTSIDQTSLASPQLPTSESALTSVTGGHNRHQCLGVYDLRQRPKVTPSTGVFGPASYMAVLNESDDAIAPSTNVAQFAKSLQKNQSALIDDDEVRAGAELLLILFEDLTFYHQMAIAPFECHSDLFPKLVVGLMFSSVQKMFDEAISDKSNPLPDLVNLSRSMFATFSKPLVVDANITPANFWTAMPNRWEIIGLLFTILGSSTCLLSQHFLSAIPASSASTLDRQGLSAVCVAAGEICLRFCENTGLISEQLCWLLLQHASLLTVIYGDYGKLDCRHSRMFGLIFGDLCTLIYALGFHQRDTNTKRPLFLAEHRKRLVVQAYVSDKGLSMFLGRPPRMLRRYIHIELPLDITYEDIMAEPKVRDAAIANLDKDGWKIDGPITLTSRKRASFILGVIRELVLETSLNPDNENLEKRISLAQEIRNGLPSTLWRIGNKEDFEREPEASRISLSFHMDFLYNELLMERLLVQRAGKEPGNLVKIAHELLSNLLHLIVLRSSAGDDNKSLVWAVRFFPSLRKIPCKKINALQISSVGLPAAGILAIELLHQFQNPHPDPSFPRSEAIQNLSRFAADLEHAVFRQSANYEMCQQARSLILHILDRVLSSPQGPAVPQFHDHDVEDDGNLFMHMDWAMNFNEWLDEDSDLLKWVNSFV